ncbi:expressed unknown protein [Seminavis robusta]|uniref:Uncharacterized protein n=1 Tax=Seminavis robusta TaxID=568900 RepID=A0A9N8HN05_9STRA|nr:expressed unknown protein [Seminavis robusta]|eukprot:Sro946_g223230.1 n/a (134) ;mRNA; r:8823-9224
MYPQDNSNNSTRCNPGTAVAAASLPDSLDSLSMAAMMQQNLRAGRFTPSSASPDRPMSLVELLPHVSLRPFSSVNRGNEGRIRPAFAQDALTRDQILSVIDRALSTLDEFDESNGVGQGRRGSTPSSELQSAQ